MLSGGFGDMAPALVTDSNSQIPAELRERFDVEVVPIPVIIDGHEFHEGVDLDADGFYAFFADGAMPEVTTSQPSPGAFIEAYRRCVDRGHDEILSVHVAKGLSGTLNSAGLAATEFDAEIQLVDTGTASFGIACCVWQAGLARDEGGDLAAMAEAAQTAAAGLHSVTALGAAQLLNASGRSPFQADEDGIQLFTTGPGGAFDLIGVATEVDDVTQRLADAMSLDGIPIRVALGVADESSVPFYERLEHLLGDRSDVVEILRYRIGPSVGAMTGPGTAGGFWFTA